MWHWIPNTVHANLHQNPCIISPLPSLIFLIFFLRQARKLAREIVQEVECLPGIRLPSLEPRVVPQALSGVLPEHRAWSEPSTLPGVAPKQTETSKAQVKTIKSFHTLDT